MSHIDTALEALLCICCICKVLIFQAFEACHMKKTSANSKDQGCSQIMAFIHQRILQYPGSFQINTNHAMDKFSRQQSDDQWWYFSYFF